MTRRKVEATQLNTAAESHWLIRSQIKSALTANKMDRSIEKFKAFDNYWEFWKSRFGPEFFDMTTMIRLGTSIETFLKEKYMDGKGHINSASIKADAAYRKGAFQRIGVGQNGPNDAAPLLLSVGIDLASKNNLQAAREVMLHRHLYAHNAGVIDEEYADKWRLLTNEDISSFVGNDEEDNYWFRPLRNLSDYVNRLLSFVAAFS